MAAASDSVRAKNALNLLKLRFRGSALLLSNVCSKHPRTIPNYRPGVPKPSAMQPSDIRKLHRLVIVHEGGSAHVLAAALLQDVPQKRRCSAAATGEDGGDLAFTQVLLFAVEESQASCATHHGRGLGHALLACVKHACVQGGAWNALVFVAADEGAVRFWNEQQVLPLHRTDPIVLEKLVPRRFDLWNPPPANRTTHLVSPLGKHRRGCVRRCQTNRVETKRMRVGEPTSALAKLCFNECCTELAAVLPVRPLRD